MNINRARLRFFLICFYTILCLIVVRLGYLQLFKHNFFLQKSTSQLKKIIKLYPNRGNVYDHKNKPLALTTTSYSAYTMPSQIKDKLEFTKKVTSVINSSQKDILKRINTRSPFVWIKRKLNSTSYQKLLDLNLEGLDFIKEEKRVYPHNNLAADILGFVGIDNQGLGGLEYKYDSLLKGSSGKIILEGDPRGCRLITGSKKTLPPNDGKNIITTIDEYIQYIAQKYLKEGVEKNQAEAGHVIVMNPGTGDILAMADYPFFNANQWSKYPVHTRKNSCVVDVFEPGSVFKVFTLAAALEENLFSYDQKIKVPEKLKIGRHTINEAHARKDGESGIYSVSQIIEKSLNVGSSLLAGQLGKEKFYEYIKSFGFGKQTGIELPGESSGLLRHPDKWAKIDLSMISFGQGVACTPLQIATAVSAIANKGLLVKPRIIKYFTQETDQTMKSIPKKTVRRVIDKETALKVTEVMTNVVKQGTAVAASLPGYNVAGKTGTAQKAKKNGRGYEHGKYMPSFVGFFPSYKPEVLILVVLDSPKKNYYASLSACPVFKKIALATADYLNIAPDYY
ncbi:MAG: penicillin-binding protein [bacterium]|nr:penicillin-binding protein [bacterium]